MVKSIMGAGGEKGACIFEDQPLPCCHYYKSVCVLVIFEDL